MRRVLGIAVVHLLVLRKISGGDAGPLDPSNPGFAHFLTLSTSRGEPRGPAGGSLSTPIRHSMKAQALPST